MHTTRTPRVHRAYIDDHNVSFGGFVRTTVARGACAQNDLDDWWVVVAKFGVVRRAKKDLDDL